MVIQIPVKISHITMDLVVLPASDRITLGLGPQFFHYMDMNEAYRCLGGIRWTKIMPFEANIYSNLAPDRAI